MITSLHGSPESAFCSSFCASHPSNCSPRGQSSRMDPPAANPFHECLPEDSTSQAGTAGSDNDEAEGAQETEDSFSEVAFASQRGKRKFASPSPRPAMPKSGDTTGSDLLSMISAKRRNIVTWMRDRYLNKLFEVGGAGRDCRHRHPM